MAPQQGGNASWRDLRNGALLQCMEAATLGMPFEVWKTRMGRFRNESTVEAFKQVYKTRGGGFRGVAAFWQGLTPKLVESASKGAVLLYSKEMITVGCLSAGLSPTITGFIAGAGGGVAQVSVMGPCTFLVTAVVTNTGKEGGSAMGTLKKTLSEKGIKGFYPGGTALAFRQASNWASRVGFTEAIRQQFKKRSTNKDQKLTVTQEAMSGILGGAVSCWNHPFEVARIEMQARSVTGEKAIGMTGVFRQVYAEHGVMGLFKGVIPRVCLGVWQTLFMVTGAQLAKDFASKK